MIFSFEIFKRMDIILTKLSENKWVYCMNYCYQKAPQKKNCTQKKNQRHTLHIYYGYVLEYCGNTNYYC